MTEVRISDWTQLGPVQQHFKFQVIYLNIQLDETDFCQNLADFDTFWNIGGYHDSGRGSRGRGGRGHLRGEIRKNPNFSLQEKYKDEFNFAKHELKEEEKEGDDAQEDPNQLETDQNEAEPTEKTEGGEEGDGFFDDFSNSTTNKEGETAEGGRDRQEMYEMNAETFGLKPYNPRYRGNNRGRNNYRGGGRYRNNRGYNNRGYNNRGNRGYRARGSYQRNDNYGYHGGGDGYKKPYYQDNESYNKPQAKYGNDSDQHEAPMNNHEEDELSFPEYKPPQVHYRGKHKRGSANQGKQPAAGGGRFAYFNEEHETQIHPYSHC